MTSRGRCIKTATFDASELGWCSSILQLFHSVSCHRLKSLIFGVSSASRNLFQMILKQSPSFCTGIDSISSGQMSLLMEHSCCFSPEEKTAARLGEPLSAALGGLN